MEYPNVYEVKGGWAAAGKGWAVHGGTQEEALENYERAVARHQAAANRMGEARQAEAAMEARGA